MCQGAVQPYCFSVPRSQRKLYWVLFNHFFYEVAMVCSNEYHGEQGVNTGLVPMLVATFSGI